MLAQMILTPIIVCRVSIIIHSAATVKFTEKIKYAKHVLSFFLIVNVYV